YGKWSVEDDAIKGMAAMDVLWTGMDSAVNGNATTGRRVTGNGLVENVQQGRSLG
ncbi:hypothetical protein E4U09_004381, partial [Claviceps aff. purpurea]